MGDSKPKREVLLTTGQAAEMLAIQRETLADWRVQGRGPRFLQLSLRCIRYRRSDVEKWIAQRERRSTSDFGGMEIGHGSG
jgi:predicted DNA-binding transcriptional regulator AlpA